jgi:hypothetical protein
VHAEGQDHLRTVAVDVLCRTRLPFAADAELIAGAHHFVVVDHDFKQLFAHELAAVLIGEGLDKPLAPGVKDFAGGGVGVLAVDAEADPAG